MDGGLKRGLVKLLLSDGPVMQWNHKKIITTLIMFYLF